MDKTDKLKVVFHHVLKPMVETVAAHLSNIIPEGAPIEEAVRAHLEATRPSSTDTDEAARISREVLQTDISRMLRLSRSRFSPEDVAAQSAFAVEELSKSLGEISAIEVARLTVGDVSLIYKRQRELLDKVGLALQAQFVMTDIERDDYMALFEDAVKHAGADARDMVSAAAK